jgi:hypothetical protein
VGVDESRVAAQTGSTTCNQICGLEADRSQPLAVGDLRSSAQPEREIGVLL